MLIHMRYQDGLSYLEQSGAFGAEPATLQARVSRAMPGLRRRVRITATLSLDERGRYQLVLLHGPQPLPAPGARVDDDLALARAAGATVALREIDVL